VEVATAEDKKTKSKKKADRSKSPQYHEEESKQDGEDGRAEIEQEEESFMTLERFGPAEAPRTAAAGVENSGRVPGARCWVRFVNNGHFSITEHRYISSAGITLELRLSSKWLPNVSCFGFVISLLVPFDSFFLPATVASSSTAPQYNPTLHPLQSIIEIILPL
jgi:hypothetical protein